MSLKYVHTTPSSKKDTPQKEDNKRGVSRENCDFNIWVVSDKSFVLPLMGSWRELNKLVFVALYRRNRLLFPYRRF